MTGADVVVYGATSAGVCAAVAAAERGASVALVEPGRHLGGMTSGGLGYTDVGDIRVLGGYAARFRQQIAEHYGVPIGHHAGPEPKVAESIFERWLSEAGVDVVLDAPLTDVETSAGSIVGVRCGEHRFDPAVIIDASYEGDLLAAAGVPYRVGREDRSRYGESLAGRQEMMPGRHSFPTGFSPFVDDPTGRREGSLLPGIHDRPLVDVGCGDGGVMSYGYRVCLTQAADRIEPERRPGYDPADFELVRRLLDHYRRTGFELTAGWLIGLTPNLPGGKCDGNSLGPFSLSVLDGSNWSYPDADSDQRELIRQHHLDHTRDFLYFLGHDPAVPSRVREEFLTWGLPPDEFVDTDHLPHQLYVREARRMTSQVLLTQHDLATGRRWPDVVALGSYHLDIREVQRCWRWAYEHPDPVAHVFNEGYLSVAVPPYPIPYRAMLPDRIDNLIVPVCLSASHVAFSSIRMEPQYQMLGHAAGIAAALTVADPTAHGDVHQVRIDALQEKLHDDGQVLDLPGSSRV
ncbi:FAD-dependent oxidoreductase [Microlunatus soli]|uniref:FAD dependent oxidoreductase n=1 Tax=Microlunatus soli TaxID=630515 RepID=A0A1H1W7P2_9ACTN|nr:FAD-dependent oxidoreductase [Microlunatus soli]SDS93328.1 FAD dependent oxidoreductase [Microlunatus soli]